MSENEVEIINRIKIRLLLHLYYKKVYTQWILFNLQYLNSLIVKLELIISTISVNNKIR